MSEVSSSDWSETDNSNTAATPNGWPEGQNPGSVNNCARAMMGALKRFWGRINGEYASTGSSNAYVLTPTVALGAYVTGERYSFRANFSNTGAATLNISSLGAKSIKKIGRAGKADPASGDIQSGAPVTVEYDGTDLILVTPVALGTSAIVDTGTSGTKVPLLDGTNTWSAAQTFPGDTAINATGALAIGGGGAIKKLTQTTVSLNFPSIATGAKADLTATVTGAVVGDIALVSFGQASRTSDLWYDAWVSVADTVTVRAFNRTGSAIDASSDIFRIVVIGF